MRKQAIESLNKSNSEEFRVNRMLDYMHLNKAYLFNKINDDKKMKYF